MIPLTKKSLTALSTLKGEINLKIQKSIKLSKIYFSFYDTTRPAQQKLLSDPIFNELLVPIHNSSKRASWDFYAMIKCGTGCNPLVYKGYGCYCGFLGSGDTVDGIDRYRDSS